MSELKDKKIEIIFIIIGVILFGVGLLVPMTDMFKESHFYYIVSSIVGVYIVFFAHLSINEKAEVKKRKINLEAQESAKKQLLEDFKNGEEIFIRVSRGFVKMPFVISIANGWKLTNERFVLNNDHFTLSDILKYQD